MWRDDEGTSVHEHTTRFASALWAQLLVRGAFGHLHPDVDSHMRPQPQALRMPHANPALAFHSRFPAHSTPVISVVA